MMKNIVSGITASLLLVATGSFAQTPAPASSSAPSDAQIAAIVVAANNDDINAGKVAKSKAKSKEVKDFAQQMVTDHTAVNKKTAALANKLKVTPEENADSKSLKDEGAASLKKLNGLKGDEFDKAYVDNEVMLHQKVLDSLDNTLIPNAKNPELKSLLTATRPAINEHLQHAKQLQASLK
jgi:putative membrane protein